jgi:hypothetical protein
VADQPPQPEPKPVKKRRRVLHTAGLTASAAVLALSIQAGSLDPDDAGPVNQYGDATILDPDATGDIER